MESYSAHLDRSHSELVEALRECENWQFHHAEPGTAEFAHYNRLLMMVDVVEERMNWYDAAKGRPSRLQGPTERGLLEGYDSGLNGGRERSEPD